MDSIKIWQRYSPLIKRTWSFSTSESAQLLAHSTKNSNGKSHNEFWCIETRFLQFRIFRIITMNSPCYKLNILVSFHLIIFSNYNKTWQNCVAESFLFLLFYYLLFVFSVKLYFMVENLFSIEKSIVEK